jgi:hypothetical protein
VKYFEQNPGRKNMQNAAFFGNITLQIPVEKNKPAAS